MKNRKLFHIADIFIAAFVICGALLFAFSGTGQGSGAVAQIRVDSELYKEIDLSRVTEPYNITISGAQTVTLHIEKGAVYFISSDCDDKICINTGVLSKAGDSAVCLPARISVAIISGGKSSVDEVSG